MWTRSVLAALGFAAVVLVGVDAGIAQGPLDRAKGSLVTERAIPQVNTVVQAPRQLPPGLSLRGGKLNVGGDYSVQVQSSTTARLNNNDGGTGTLTCEGCCTISWSGGTLSCTKTGDCGCISKIEIPLPKAMAR
jgi:hypothetical protein